MIQVLCLKCVLPGVGSSIECIALPLVAGSALLIMILSLFFVQSKYGVEALASSLGVEHMVSSLPSYFCIYECKGRLYCYGSLHVFACLGKPGYPVGGAT